MELKGTVAIVTGGGRGIGRATALELGRLGADIVVAELDEAGAKRTAMARRPRAPSPCGRTSPSARTCARWSTAPKASSAGSTSS